MTPSEQGHVTALKPSGKITLAHLTELALVYVRQSTPQQMTDNRESLARQYALASHAVALGWPSDRVIVIDEDLGLSGRTAEGRPGFQRLLAEVTMGHVGLILGLEMSRLARSCKDWYQLLEVCAIFGTLLADQDGVYDPADPNDRLLLGLKGQISELELHTIRTRLDRGRLNKARRGELFLHAPIGYVKTPAGILAWDPDEQVRSVVRLIFEKFVELGTVHALVRYLRQHHIRLGVRPIDGPNRGQLEWRPARLSTLHRMLHNPLYAGTYVFGQHVVNPKRRRRDGQTPCIRVTAMDEWQVVIHDQVPAYISWADYLRNRERLRNNRTTAATPGHARKGTALLSGLVVCKTCGHRMHALYSTPGHPRYECVSHLNRGEERTCPGLVAAPLDGLVADQVLGVLTPAGIDLCVRAKGDIEKERGRLDAHWRAEIDRATYEARLAERSYRAVDPENRLVARSLERQWEEALRHEREVLEGYDRFRCETPQRLTPDELDRIHSLAADIPALWRAADTPAVDRKQILRTLVERVTVKVQETSEHVQVEIQWIGGSVSTHSLRRPVGNYERLADFDRLRERVTAWVTAGKSVAEVAEQLNQEGFLPASGRLDRFTRRRAAELIYRLGLSKKRAPAEPLSANEWWVRDLAVKVGVSVTRLRHWIERGYVHTRKSKAWGQLVVWADAEELGRLRRLRDHPRQNRVAQYPAELIRPKERQTEVPKGRQKKKPKRG
jgi:DNA invertase Pin-like site-specific DNA recombinase